MSFSAILHLGDEKPSSFDTPGTIKILDCDYGFTQKVDSASRPDERPKGGLISLVIEATKNEELVDWMIDPDMVKDGSIVFMGREGEGAMRTLKFKNAFCVQFHEKFSSEGAIPMVTFLTISFGEITVNDIPYTNNWPTK